MMNQSFLVLIILFIVQTTWGQTGKKKTAFNFNFEKTNKNMPIGWGSFGSSGYELGLSKKSTQDGEYAATIEYKSGNKDFKAWSFPIKDSYLGKKITLTGYIKTENVTEGHAGLWMRIDPSIGFDNMNDRGIKGTTDWTKYSVTLKLDPKRTTQIVVGALLVGKGKMWIDNLEVTIDGKKLDELTPLSKKIYPADNDKAFSDNSKIASLSTSDEQLENLKTLGLIWGFLKYYHPEVAKGNYNWDNELFRFLPKLTKAKNKTDRDQILVKWIRKFGKIGKGKTKINRNKEIKIEPDLDWISDSNFSKELTSILTDIKNAKRGDMHYLSLLEYDSILFPV